LRNQPGDRFHVAAARRAVAGGGRLVEGEPVEDEPPVLEPAVGDSFAVCARRSYLKFLMEAVGIEPTSAAAPAERLQA
jgi:hypothetical protein